MHQQDPKLSGDQPDHSDCPQVLPPGCTPQDWASPVEQAKRDDLIDQEMARRGHPCNPKNAARAGWYAAMRYIVEQGTTE